MKTLINILGLGALHVFGRLSDSVGQPARQVTPSSAPQSKAN